ncbi:hypothetical protein Cgig2_023380 [Carnegiea gigantea]|uniref:Aminotransferase-like plant mobile domain-containing protein n=1 Tax=Carnegiea gigantea TaxID=171969 RepID=A0A9Q1GQ20_9CARY|nr:hypothetical protein Cgig2_023380 [Carnegiea gigantea]
MVTFLDKTTSGRRYLHIQPSENDVDGEETKLPVRNPITSLCKPDCVRGPPSLPWWSKENLKTGEIFLLSTHVKMKENLPSYQLLRHDIESERRSWAKLPLHGEFSYKPLYWECKYHVSKKPDQGSRIPQPGILSPLPDAGARYCLPTAVLASIYKGLNELSRSSHPGRGGGHFPTHFLYAWLAKNFDVYELVGEASSSPGMVKFSGLGRAKSFQPEEARELIAMLRYHHMLTRYGTGSQVLLPGRCNLLERNITRAFREWWPKMFVSPPCSPHANGSKRKRSDLSDTNISKDEGKLKPKLKIIHSGRPVEPFVPVIENGSSRVDIPGIDVGPLVMPIPAIPIQSIAPLPQDELPVEVCEPSTQKVTELPPEDAENIMDIFDAEPNPIECMGESDDVNFKEGLAHIPLPSGSQCFPSVGRIPSFGKDLFDSRSRLVSSRGVCPPDDDEVEFIRKVNAHSPVPCPQRPLKVPQGGISVFDADAFIKEVDKNAARVLGKAILDKVCRTPFDRLPSLRGDLDSLYATILQRGVDVTPLESRVEGLIRQACDFKDLQQSYSGRISAEEHNNCRMEVQGKLDEASRQVNTEGTHYEAKAAELKHVESRRQELMKELQLLEDQQKELSSQVAASEHLLQEAEREVIDLQGQIEVLNATEVMDAATKASLEKAEAYIKESFEDLKNFQWDP